MKKHYLFWVFLCCLVTFISYGNKVAMGFSSEPIIETFGRAVVEVIGKDQGTGIVVGKRDGNIFILTAFHVVKEASEVEINYHKHWETSKGQLFHKKNEALDIGVVIVELDPSGDLYDSFPQFVVGEPKEESDVEGIAIPLGKGWRKITSDIQSLSFDGDPDKLTITKTAIIKQGCSGGPLFDNQRNLIGMITDIDAIEAIAVKIDKALLWLNDKGIPTNLIVMEPVIYSSGTACILRAQSFDLDEGLDDISYSSSDGIEYNLWGTFSYFGFGDFDQITLSDLFNAQYSLDRISAGFGPSNRLKPDTIIFVQTKEGRFAKIQVEKYGEPFNFHWITYAKAGETAPSSSPIKYGACTYEEFFEGAGNKCNAGKLPGDEIKFVKGISYEERGEVIVDVDYTWDPNHSNNEVYIGASVLDYLSNELTYGWGYHPTSTPNNGGGTVRIHARIERPGEPKELFIYMKGDGIMICRRFPFPSSWKE